VAAGGDVIQITISVRSLVIILVLGVALFAGSDVARGAPSQANLTADNQLQFTSTGFNTPHDINVVDHAGALRFYACPTLTNPPNCAAIQFYGNDANVFGGQAFLDSGASPNAAVIFRTATGGNAINERMRVAANGNVGIGTQDPKSALQVVGNYIQFPYAQTFTPPPASDCDDGSELGRSKIQPAPIGATLYVCTFSGSPNPAFGWAPISTQ
jgi:hypothetical protein